MRFFQEILRAPHVTGAIAPSSPFLAKAVVAEAGVAAASRILELGPGTGVITARILREKSADARFVAIEKNENFIPGLRSRFPGVSVIPGCASQLSEHANASDFINADSIVSGLPWAIFDESLQAAILNSITKVLAGDGTFVTFAYLGPHLLPAGQSFRNLLKKHFSSVRMSRPIFANLPPAFVYVCRNA